METIRQGDLLFIPMTELKEGQLPYEARPENLRKNGVIQEGEATGHHHCVAVLEDAEVFRPQWGSAIVRVSERGVSIVHEEHAPVTLQPNTTYRVHVAREFDYLRQTARRVRD